LFVLKLGHGIKQGGARVASKLCDSATLVGKVYFGTFFVQLQLQLQNKQCTKFSGLKGTVSQDFQPSVFSPINSPKKKQKKTLPRSLISILKYF
jgi:hypothetical protein